MRGLQPYLAYRSLESDLLRQLPAHWRAVRLKHLLAAPFQYGANESSEFADRNEPRFIRITDIDDSGGLREDTFRSLPERIARPYLLRDKDILLARSGATVGKSFMYLAEWGKACFAGYLIRARTLEGICLPVWLNYFCQTDEYWDYVRGAQIQATIQNVSAEKYGAVKLPIPPLEEQTQIARFLDYETAKIDALIEKQEQLIALLKEKRQAVISHAVTKGLDPNAPLRDSGIEWLGQVPAHWEVVNLNRVVGTFVDYRGRTPEKTDEGRPLITAGTIKEGVVDFERSPQFVSERTYHELRQRGVPEVGDLLFTSEAPLGEVALVDDVAIACAQRIIMFKVIRRRMTPRYLWLFLRSQAGRDEILTKASGSTAEGIRADRLRRSRIPVPPLGEQKSIYEYVDDTLKNFDAIIQTAAAQSTLLAERRTALISAAVTGKIDVRGWKPPEGSEDGASERAENRVASNRAEEVA